MSTAMFIYNPYNEVPLRLRNYELLKEGFVSLSHMNEYCCISGVHNASVSTTSDM